MNKGNNQSEQAAGGDQATDDDAAAAKKDNQNATTTINNVDQNDDEEEDDQLLMEAIKDAQFIQPDLGLFTMRFKSDEESKFRAYLLGLNAAAPTGGGLNQVQSNNHHHHNHHHHKFSSSLRIWAHPHNMLFVSFLLAVCVNLCVATAYFLTFVVASMSAYEYKLTDTYSVDFVLILSLFCLLCLIQLGVLFVNFWTCNRVMRSRNNAAPPLPHSSSAANTEFSGKTDTPIDPMLD